MAYNGDERSIKLGFFNGDMTFDGAKSAFVDVGYDEEDAVMMVQDLTDEKAEFDQYVEDENWQMAAELLISQEIAEDEDDAFEILEDFGFEYEEPDGEDEESSEFED